jgi:SAM-dependent methyltransferase
VFRAQHVLKIPTAYRLFQKLIGGGFHTVYVRDYLKAQPGERVLDIGCGPGDLLAHLPACEYVGIDMDAYYVRAARERFGPPRGTFHCIPVEQFVVEESASFDLVMANGVLHHLDDTQAAALFLVARQALRPGGRLVTLDGCFVPNQSWVARRLLQMDRGRFIRTELAYVNLARVRFPQVQGQVRHDLLALPYTHLIMTCKQEAG